MKECSHNVTLVTTVQTAKSALAQLKNTGTVYPLVIQLNFFGGKCSWP